MACISDYDAVLRFALAQLKYLPHVYHVPKKCKAVITDQHLISSVHSVNTNFSIRTRMDWPLDLNLIKYLYDQGVELLAVKQTIGLPY